MSRRTWRYMTYRCLRFRYLGFPIQHLSCPGCSVVALRILTSNTDTRAIAIRSEKHVLTNVIRTRTRLNISRDDEIF